MATLAEVPFKPRLRSVENGGAKPSVFDDGDASGDIGKPRARFGRRSRRLVIGGLAAALAIAAVSVGLMVSNGVVLASSEVTLAEVRQERFAPLIVGTGRVSTESGRTLAALEGGVVEKVLRRTGDRVSAGEVIVVLANPTLEREVGEALLRLETEHSALRAQEADGDRQIAAANDRVREAQYRHQLARNELDRNLQLEERGFASKAKMDRLREDLAFTREGLDGAERERARIAAVEAERGAGRADAYRRLSDMKALQSGRLQALQIRAPISGVLSGVAVREGAPVRASDVIAQISVEETVKVEAKIADVSAPLLKVGGAARLLDDRGAALTIRSIDPEVDQGTVTVRLEFVAGARPDLKPGQTLQLAFEAGPSRPARVVRYGDLVGPDQAWVVDRDGRAARLKPVRLGDRAGDDVEVLAGVGPGERLLIGSGRALEGHRRVRIRP